MYIRVLLVDDNIPALYALQRMLAPLRAEWEMVLAKNGHEALALLEQEPVAAVLTVVGMAEMGGAALLEAVAQMHPEVLRLALLGPDDDRVAARLTVPAQQFIDLPCEPIALRDIVRRALRLRGLLTSDALQRLVGEVHDLPALPDLYLRVMQELRAPDSSLGSIGRIIEQDVAMSAKVLTLVNSAYFALPQTVTSPTLAVGLLGLQTIRSMILLFDVFTQYERLSLLAPSINLATLQQHSLTVGTYARAIARAEGLDVPTVETYFIAGLFHDIGKLVLLANFPLEYNQALEMAQHRRSDPAAAELASFNATHAEVGAYLLGKWGFVDPVVEAVGYHHRPGDMLVNAVTPALAVHVANVLAQEQALPGGWTPTIDQETLAFCGMEERLPAWREACGLRELAPA